MELFNFIGKNDNDMLSKLSEKDLDMFLNYLDNYYLKLREELGFDKFITFGLEFEFDTSMRVRIKERIKEYFENFNEQPWIFTIDKTCGFEVKTDILIDNKRNWEDIKSVLKIIRDDATIDASCGGHIHLGSQIIGEDRNTWLNFIKIWELYENVIFRFTSGEFLITRPMAKSFAGHLSPLFNETYTKAIEENLSLNEILKLISGRKRAINFQNITDLSTFESYNTIEFRCPNASLNPVIWQNNLNLFVNLILKSKDDLDLDEISYQNKDYDGIDLKQALEFCDLVFNNNLDKVYFLRQYLKSFKIGTRPYEMAKRFTRY